MQLLWMKKINEIAYKLDLSKNIFLAFLKSWHYCLRVPSLAFNYLLRTLIIFIIQFIVHSPLPIVVILISVSSRTPSCSAILFVITLKLIYTDTSSYYLGTKLTGGNDILHYKRIPDPRPCRLESQKRVK